MKILILGNSDTRGAVVPGPTWPTQAGRRLEAGWGASVDLEDRPFAPMGPNPAGYAEQLVANAEADIVILPLGEYAFWAASVHEQVRHLLGARAAAFYRRMERRFETSTKGRSGVRGASHDRARWVMRRLVGTRALASAGAVANVYTETMRRLSHFEDLQAVIVAYPISPLPGLSAPKMQAARSGFLLELRNVAQSHRLAWLDGDAMLGRAGVSSVEAYFGDGVHMNQRGHDLLASELVELLRPSLSDATSTSVP